jgi:hypothetical protein
MHYANINEVQRILHCDKAAIIFFLQTLEFRKIQQTQTLKHSLHHCHGKSVTFLGGNVYEVASERLRYRVTILNPIQIIQ